MISDAIPTAEILESLARVAWAKRGREGKCPASAIPTAETLALWLPDCPEDVRIGAGKALAVALAADAAKWHPLAERGEDGKPVPFGLVAFVQLKGWAGWATAGGIDAVHAKWADAPKDKRGKHPLGAIVQAWQSRPVPIQSASAKAIVKKERRPPRGRKPVILTIEPGPLALASAPMEAVEIDGQAFVTVAPDGDGKGRRRWRVKGAAQGELWPGPKSLAGEATSGAVFGAAADMSLAGDERNPIRADLLRVAAVAVSLYRPVELTEAEGALLVGGADTPANRKRFNRAMWAARGMAFEAKPGIFWPLVDSLPGPLNRLGPARWWLERKAEGHEKGRAFRLTGTVFRAATKWGALERTISGLEGALTWGPFWRGRKSSKLPENLQPVRGGGPGPDVFVEWWRVLRLAAEPVEADADPDGSHRRRYTRRVDDLRKAGYFVPTGGGEAPAGDTVEIVEQVRGARHRRAGLVIRASARFCAAYAKGESIRIPAARLIEHKRP